MLNRLWVRMTLVFVAIILIVAGTLSLIPPLVDRDNVHEQIIARQIDAPGGLLKKLSLYHEKNGNSWDGIETFMDGVQAATSIDRRPGRFYLILTDADKNILYDPRPQNLTQSTERADSRRTAPQPIISSKNKKPIGYIQTWNLRRANNEPPPDRFDLFTEFRRLLWLALLLIIPFGILGSIWVSRLLTAPLTQLAEAARDVGTGNLNRRVDVSGTIEIREVANAFNEMTSDLGEAEQLRRNLVADIAHELRTPLTVVQGNLRAILDDVYPLNKEEVARLYDQTRILAQLVQDLRDVAQAEAGQLHLNLAATDVGQLVQKTTSTFGSIAEEEGLALQINTQPNLPTVQLDSTRLAQVLHNLLSNAVRHTPRNGTISVDVTAAPNHASTAGNIPVGNSAGGNTAVGNTTDNAIEIAIRDTGAGIDSQHLPRIFDRFYRTERARDRDSGGTGLGLAIAQALINAHGGSIRAESPGLGQGSTFTISLPQDTLAHSHSHSHTPSPT